jgi:hypothetical protein
MPMRPSMYYTHCLFLGDGFLTPIRLVNAITSIIERSRTLNQRVIYGHSRSRAHWDSKALFFAGAASTIDGHSSLEISSLPAEIMAIGSEPGLVGCRMRDLLPGTWTALLYTARKFRGSANSGYEHWSGPRRVQCAFIRPKNGAIRLDPAKRSLFQMKDLEILDVGAFLRATVPGFDIQHAIALDCQLQRLEELTKYDPGSLDCGPPFSRAPMDKGVVCDLLNRANFPRK